MAGNVSQNCLYHLVRWLLDMVFHLFRTQGSEHRLASGGQFSMGLEDLVDSLG